VVTFDRLDWAKDRLEALLPLLDLLGVKFRFGLEWSNDALLLLAAAKILLHVFVAKL
jgi:hypothetical protein